MRYLAARVEHAEVEQKAVGVLLCDQSPQPPLTLGSLRDTPSSTLGDRMIAESSGYAWQKLSEAVGVLATSSDSLSERLRMARAGLITLKIHDGNLSESRRTEFSDLVEQLSNVDKLSIGEQKTLANKLWSLFSEVTEA